MCQYFLPVWAVITKEGAYSWLQWLTFQIQNPCSVLVLGLHSLAFFQALFLQFPKLAAGLSCKYFQHYTAGFLFTYLFIFFSDCLLFHCSILESWAVHSFVWRTREKGESWLQAGARSPSRYQVFFCVEERRVCREIRRRKNCHPGKSCSCHNFRLLGLD